MKTIMSKNFYAKIKWIILACAATFLSIGAIYAQGQGKIYIYAAASTTDVVKEIIESYKHANKSSVEFVTVFGSSGDLAKQIEAGADANIFISADTKWVKYLEEKKFVEAGTSGIFASNDLVIVASPMAKSKLKSPEKLFEALGDSNLAMGDTKSVPAGKYGKEALEYHKAWEKISGANKIAYYPDVRKTLNAVETSQCDYGIVYKTDAMMSSKVKIVYTFKAKSHSPIDYPACVVNGKNNDEVKAFMKFLKAGKAKQILKKYGFAVK
ncbi:MAG TPA: molybdate ABC transporter substrate-binding protein [Spirochaetota bacterium]|nr:molybdate ABC transporter substrate-binding protein [Spirochaetota bacterium]